MLDELLDTKTSDEDTQLTPTHIVVPPIGVTAARMVAFYYLDCVDTMDQLPGAEELKPDERRAGGVLSWFGVQQSKVDSIPEIDKKAAALTVNVLRSLREGTLAGNPLTEAVGSTSLSLDEAIALGWAAFMMVKPVNIGSFLKMGVKGIALLMTFKTLSKKLGTDVVLWRAKYPELVSSFDALGFRPGVDDTTADSTRQGGDHLH